MARMHAGGARRRRLACVALGAVAALAALAAAPVAAAASTPGGTSPGLVYPFLDCSVHNADGSWTVVFGYTNTGSTMISLPAGLTNAVTPSPAYGSLPTSFEPGVHHAVFAVKVGAAVSPTWSVDGIGVSIIPSAGTLCPAGTPLPGDGNGAGAALALVGTGALGALCLLRLRRPLLTAEARTTERQAVDA
jgi:hypothetical protein